MTDFNVRNVTGLVLEGGKSLTASNTTAQGLKVTNTVTLPGLRFRTRVEGRNLWAFAPFKSIVGIYGSAEGAPTADPTITFDAAGLEGLFLVGGRFLKVMKAEAVAGFDGSDALRLVDISNNLGDSKSLVTHPATTTHSRLKPEERAALGIGDGLVRLSAGLEGEADLLKDLERALAAI